MNRKLVELGLIDEDILNDRKAGRVFKEEYDYTDWKDDYSPLEIESTDLIKPEPLKGSQRGMDFIRKFHKDNFYI